MHAHLSSGPHKYTTERVRIYISLFGLTLLPTLPLTTYYVYESIEELKLNVSFSFAEPSFIGTTNISSSPGGIEVECSVYDPCLQAVIELKCQDSSGSIVYDVVQPSSIAWSHTIPKIVLIECETYTVIIIVSYPGIDNVASQQSEILYETQQGHGEYLIVSNARFLSLCIIWEWESVEELYILIFINENIKSYSKGISAMRLIILNS